MADRVGVADRIVADVLFGIFGNTGKFVVGGPVGVGVVIPADHHQQVAVISA